MSKFPTLSPADADIPAAKAVDASTIPAKAEAPKADEKAETLTDASPKVEEVSIIFKYDNTNWIESTRVIFFIYID